MDVKTLLRRAQRGFREDRGLYMVALSSLTVAFLCLAGALLAVTNLSSFAARLGQTRHMTIYLRDGARGQDVDQLRLLLEGLVEVEKVEHLTEAGARERFLADRQVAAELGDLPPEAFPASLEVDLRASATPARIDAIGQRVAGIGAVADVESYRGWFDQLHALLLAGRAVALALAILVLICVLAVVGNTIRLAVAGRRREIEVMKLCGATDAFIRGPFVVEGAVQGLLSSTIAVVLLLVGYLVLEGQVHDGVAILAGIRLSFLDLWMTVAVIVGGTAVGAIGSTLSLRRYMSV